MHKSTADRIEEYRSDIKKKSGGTPQDVCYIARLSCFLIGIAAIFGYSSLFAAADFFKSDYPNYPNLMFQVVVALNAFNFIGILILIPCSTTLSILTRIVVLYILMGFALLSIPFYSNRSLFHQDFAVILVLISSSAAGYTAGTMCTTNCAYSQFLQSNYIQSVLVGESLSNIIGCVLRFITKFFFSQHQGTEIFFITAASISFAAVVIFYLSYQTDFVKYQMAPYHEDRQRKLRRRKKIHNSIYRETLSSKNSKKMKKSSSRQRKNIKTKNKRELEHSTKGAKSIDSPDMVFEVNMDSKDGHYFPFPDRTEELRFDSDSNDSDDDSDNCSDMSSVRSGVFSVQVIKQLSRNAAKSAKSKRANGGGSVGSSMILEVKYVQIAIKLKYMIAAIMLVNLVTFILYPSFVQGIKSQYGFLNKGDWFALLVTFLFSISDFVGRQFFASYVPFKDKIKETNLWCLALMRFCFIPLILMFNFEWIVSDFGLYFSVIFMSLTGGYITTLIFLKYPQLLDEHEQEIGAAIMQLALVGGLSLGSIVALVLVSVI